MNHSKFRTYAETTFDGITAGSMCIYDKDTDMNTVDGRSEMGKGAFDTLGGFALCMWG